MDHFPKIVRLKLDPFKAKGSIHPFVIRVNTRTENTGNCMEIVLNGAFNRDDLWDQILVCLALTDVPGDSFCRRWYLCSMP